MAEASDFGVCQCCFELNDCLNMGASYLHAGVTENYAEMLMETFSLEVAGSSSDKEGQPLICSECVLRLRDAHAFRAQVRRVQARLRDQGERKYPVIIKVESQERDAGDEPPQGAMGGLQHARGGGGADAPPRKSPRHIETKNVFMCEICRRGFNLKYKLVGHLKTHNGPKPYGKYSNGVICHTSNSKSNSTAGLCEKPYICKYCNAAFKANQKLKRHLKTHSIKKTYICEYCNAEFRSNNNLSRHHKTHTGQKPYICEYCNAAFSDNSNLRKHIMRHTDQKPYICEHCNASFSENGCLKKHLRRHTGEKPYICNNCNAVFSTNSQLNRHLRTHTGEKPYTCEVCNAAFSRRYLLTSHLRIHTGEKPYICKLCNAEFSENLMLSKHLKTHW